MASLGTLPGVILGASSAQIPALTLVDHARCSLLYKKFVNNLLKIERETVFDSIVTTYLTYVL